MRRRDSELKRTTHINEAPTHLGRLGTSPLLLLLLVLPALLPRPRGPIRILLLLLIPLLLLLLLHKSRRLSLSPNILGRTSRGPPSPLGVPPRHSMNPRLPLALGAHARIHLTPPLLLLPLPLLAPNLLTQQLVHRAFDDLHLLSEGVEAVAEGVDFAVEGEVGGGLSLGLSGGLGTEGGEGCRVGFERAGEVGDLGMEAVDLGFEICEREIESVGTHA